MAVLFSDGFESNDFSAWTGTGGAPAVQGGVVHHGSYAADFDVTSGWAWQYCYKDIAAVTTVYLRAYVRFESFVNARQFALYLDGTGGAVVLAGVNASGANWLIFDNTTGLEHTQADTINASQWYCLELKAIIAAGSGEYRLYIDGVEKVTVTGLTNNGNGNIDSVLVGGFDWGTVSFSHYIDCVVVADAYIGPEAGGLSIPVAMHHYGHHINKIIRG